MALLVSVNVGLPKDVLWQGQTVHTAVWKAPVPGRAMFRRLNIDGDGQGDLQGHGGEHRAVMVYQLDSYRYWEKLLDLSPMGSGSFGENLTVDGLPDDEVCIGDRYRVGGALLEVTQPRVTCYRLGLRLGIPQMPSLVVAHKRPGFYCRVIEEGLAGAGDRLVKETSGSTMTVAQISGLLYLDNHPREDLERALQIPSLSAGWRESFAALLASDPDARGNAGLAAPPADPAAWQGFRDVVVKETHAENEFVRSFVLEASTGAPLPQALGGQFIVLKMSLPPPRLPVVRSYSLSRGSRGGLYRFSVKRGTGEGSTHLHDAVREGSRLSISAPRGSFVLAHEQRPVVFWGAGIGITPLLAMLYDLAGRPDRDEITGYWLYGARNAAEDVFADEVGTLLSSLPHFKRFLAYSHPAAASPAPPRFDLEGRISAATIVALRIPADAHFYLCGPTDFLDQSRAALLKLGYDDQSISSERFGTGEAFRPGIAARLTATPHLPVNTSSTGPLVSFVRSGLTMHWDDRYATLLDLAEACDVPVRWSCRSGVCHTCESQLIDGRIRYSPSPLQAPADGRVLICCASPCSDVQLDL